MSIFRLLPAVALIVLALSIEACNWRECRKVGHGIMYCLGRVN